MSKKTAGPQPDKPSKKVRKQSQVSLVENVEVFKISDSSLTMKEKIFVCAYCANGFNAARAYRAAEPSCPEGKEGDYKAAQSGYDMKCRPHIQQAIKAYLEEALKDYKESLHYKIIKTNIHRAFYDLANFFDDKGRMKPLSKIPPEERVCIDGIKKNTGEEAVYILSDRVKALDMLTKYMNIIKPDNVADTVDIKVIQDIAGKGVEVKIKRLEERGELSAQADWIERGGETAGARQEEN